jgi:NAD(P)H-dependent FMN reductase
VHACYTAAVKLHVIAVSTRPGRNGIHIARWVDTLACEHGKFDVALVDLAEVNLPLMDEPNHPRLRQYTKEHTKKWSALVDAADAFVFVAPEYNYSMAPSLVNAVDYLQQEWKYKAAGIVSYGGVSGGLRATQMAKQLLTAVGVMPAADVPIPMFPQFLVDGTWTPNEIMTKSVGAMLDEVFKWATATRTLRG